MTAGYTIGVRGDQHLGYAPMGMRLNRASRWNQRIVDGHVAHEHTTRDMLTAGVAGIVDGGDLFHWARPLPRDVETANRVDDIRAKADGVWAVVNSGNHDAGGGADMSAAGVIHRPELGARGVYPDPLRGPGDGIGPWPGLYEIHTEQSNPQLPPGLALHMVSHYGLSKALPEQGVTIEPSPLPGQVNLLFAHGVFAADGRLFDCLNPHGEERAIPTEWAHAGFDALLLSHYHTLGPVPGFDHGTSGQVWYTGSSLARGFSDEPGPRGWLLVTVHDTGRVEITPHYIWQRTQRDLPVIDAAGLTVAQIDEAVTEALSQVELTDPVAGEITGDDGAIVRQRIVNTVPTQRQGINALAARFERLSNQACWWRITYDQATGTAPAGSATVSRPVTSRVTDFAAELHTRSAKLVHRAGVPEPLVEPSLKHAQAWVEEIAPASAAGEQDFTAGSHGGP